MRTVSVSTALFDGYPMEAAINEIAAAGARFVEPAFIRGYLAFDESAFSEASGGRLERLIRESGLSAIAVSAHLNLGLPDAVPMLRRRVAFASRLGSSFLITNAGARRNREDVLAAVLAVLPDCEQAGVVLALENPGHGTDDLIGNGGEGAELIKAIGSPLVRLNYDAGNVFTYSGGALRPENDIAAALPLVAHLHLKDVAERAQGWFFSALGEGSLDYPALWRRLPRDLPVGIELPLRLERRRRADPVRGAETVPMPSIRTALRRSLAFVTMLDQADSGKKDT